MNTRERFQAVMNFQPFDRLPVIEWAIWWDKTLERWHTEGLPVELTDRYDLYRHFGLDMYYQEWTWPTVPPAPHHGAPVISTPEEYHKLRDSLYPANPLNLKLIEKWAAEQQAGNAVVWHTIMGAFWYPRMLFGIEPHMYAFYDYPDLMKLMIHDLLEWNLRVVDQFCRVCTPDYVVFAEDMSYNHGPMLSRELFEEFLAPYYAQMTPELHKRGILVIVDSDGDITEPTGWYAKTGVDGMLPLERQSGVDIKVMREKYPRMRFVGHYDKMVMPHGKHAMRREFGRLLPTIAKGGFLVGVDHQTPPGVSYQQYLIYLRLLREYAEKAGQMSRLQADQQPAPKG